MDGQACSSLLKAPFAVSMGDPAGVGPEIIVKSWIKRREYKLAPFFVVGNKDYFDKYFSGPTICINDPSETFSVFEKALPIFHIDCVDDLEPAKPNIASAEMAYQALETATDIVLSGKASAIITAPVSKKYLYEVGFSHPGQTEYIAEKCSIRSIKIPDYRYFKAENYHYS